jgi:hypothetical protein
VKLQNSAGIEIGKYLDSAKLSEYSPTIRISRKFGENDTPVKHHANSMPATPVLFTGANQRFADVFI